MSIKKIDLDGTLKYRVGKDISPRTPARVYSYLKYLVQYFEQELTDVPHYYKGGFFIGEYTGEPRYTQDVDMGIVYLPTYERVKESLAKFGDLLVAEGIIGKYSVKESVSERSSGGAKYYALDGSILFSADIDYQEYPLNTCSLILNDYDVIQVSTVEQMLCDKLNALYSDGKFRRVKDLFDAWHILSNCQINDDCFIDCLGNAGIAPLPSSSGPFTEDNICKMENAYNTISIFTVGVSSERLKPDFWEIVKIVGDFCCRFSDAEV